MRQLEIERKSLGVTFIEDGAATATVWAPLRESVAVLVNDTQKIGLQQAEHGYW